MGIASILSITLILLGAAIMVLSLRRSLKTQWLLREFASREATVLRRFNMLHQALMLFFLFGYMAVAWGIGSRKAVISEPFVGLIFFFGAIFVLLGIHLQSTMNGMISQRYQQARLAKQDLERERTQLLQLNAQLSEEIAERQKAEALIRESEARLRLILDNLPMGIMIIDAQTLMVSEVNALAEAMIGVDREGIIGSTCHTFIGEVDGTNCPLQNSGRRMHKAELTLHTQHDEEIPILKTVCRINLANKPHFLEAFLDISDKKQLESELQRSQKMEMLGTLAGKVAHDLNNILSGLVSYPELLLLDMAADDPKRKALEIIERSGKKAAFIVQDLLTLARRGPAVHEVVNLNEVVREYLSSPEHERLRRLHPQVEFRHTTEEAFLPVEGSPVHLGKTVMNLVANAAEALPQGGLVQLELYNRYIDQPVAGYDEIQEGDYAVLMVSDDGVGIGEDEQERIFEPFYSRKVMGQSGTGLGMAVVWTTVKDHNGYIEMVSTPDMGTAFFLYFPVTRKPASQMVRDDVVDLGKGEQVLVVDDMEDQREIASSILRRLGYTVTVADSGEEAVALVEKGGLYDLVLLDMAMDQGMDGAETFRHLHRIRPALVTVLASGFSEPGRIQELLAMGAASYIRKPYALAGLGRVVRKALDDKGRAGDLRSPALGNDQPMTSEAGT